MLVSFDTCDTCSSEVSLYYFSCSFSVPMDDRGTHSRFVHSMSESKLYPHGKPQIKLRKSVRTGAGSASLSNSGVRVTSVESIEQPYSSLSKEGFVFGNAAKAQKAAAQKVSAKLNAEIERWDLSRRWHEDTNHHAVRRTGKVAREAPTRWGGIRTEHEGPLMLKGKMCESEWDRNFFIERSKKKNDHGIPLWPSVYPEDDMWDDRLMRTPTICRLENVRLFAMNKQRQAEGKATLD